MMVAEDDLRRALFDGERETLEIYNGQVAAERDVCVSRDGGHARDTVRGVFEILEVIRFERLGDADTGFDRPDTIRVNAQLVVGEFTAQQAHRLDFFVGWKYAAFQLDGREAKLLAKLARQTDHRFGRIYVTPPVILPLVFEKEITGERHAWTYQAAEQIV